MSRTSRVPYHQNVYDLFDLELRESPEAMRTIADWEQESHRRFPVALHEFYGSEGEIRYGRDTDRRWPVTLVSLWSEYSDIGRACALSDLFGPVNLPEQQEPQPLYYFAAHHRHTFFRLFVEEQSGFALYAQDIGAANPPVFTTNCACRPLNQWGGNRVQREGWQELGLFTEVLFTWFSLLYSNRSFTPRSFRARSWFARRPEAPQKRYRNGLWLRTPYEPFAVPIIDFLIEQFGEPEVTPRPGEVTTYTYRPVGGTIRVTADAPWHPEPLSVWWVHADSRDRLAELARLLGQWGTLRTTLRADTDVAREVWNRVRRS